MHHGRNTHTGYGGKLYAVTGFHIVRKLPKARLQPLPHKLKAVGPEAVFKLVLPIEATGRHAVVSHRLDAR
jgi:hypothetical protein